MQSRLHAGPRTTHTSPTPSLPRLLSLSSDDDEEPLRAVMLHSVLAEALQILDDAEDDFDVFFS